MSHRRSFVRSVALMGSLALALVGCGGNTDRTMVEPYGQERLQEGEWYLPEGGPHPVVVLLHGGCYQPNYNRHLEDKVAVRLKEEGFAVWNVDYRPPALAPYPATFEDVARAVDHLPESRYRDRLDLSRVALVGHSAGGQLALWAGSLSVSSPTPPSLRPRLVVAQAPLADLTLAQESGVCGRGVQQLMGGSAAGAPENYRAGDPALLSPQAPVVLLHGPDDVVVPLELSESYRNTAGQESAVPVDLVEVPGDHFSHLEPDSVAVEQLVSSLRSGLG